MNTKKDKKIRVFEIPEYKEIGLRLKVIRKAKHFTQLEMAKFLEVSQPFYCNIENGQRSLSMQMLRKVCDLGFQPEWVIYGRTLYTDQHRNRILDELEGYLPLLHSEQLRFLTQMAKVMQRDNITDATETESEDDI